jgi:CheY-like chemotaxis protein
METSARAALERLRAGERFDAILCDLMMPEMTGMQFHAGLSAAAPEQASRVLFLTGGAFTPATQAFLAGVPNPRVDKPFDGDALRAIVAEIAGRR